MKPILLVILTLTTLVSCNSTCAPGQVQTYNGKPVLTRASHPAGGSMAPVEGTHLERRYFHPPGVKGGLAHVDIYGQR